MRALLIPPPIMTFLAVILGQDARASNAGVTGSAGLSSQAFAGWSLWNSGRLARRGAFAIGWGDGDGERFNHDLADGNGATAALGAAAEAAIDFGGGVRRRRLHDRSYIVVAQDVAGTDDHRSLKPSR